MNDHTAAKAVASHRTPKGLRNARFREKIDFDLSAVYL